MSRERIRDWANALLAKASVELSLDDVSEVIGTSLASTDDIEQLFALLEQAGRRIEVRDGPPPAEKLRAVLASAKALKTSGKAPTCQEIAKHAGLSLDEVRGALLFAVVLSR